MLPRGESAAREHTLPHLDRRAGARLPREGGREVEAPSHRRGVRPQRQRPIERVRELAFEPHRLGAQGLDERRQRTRDDGHSGGEGLERRDGGPFLGREVHEHARARHEARELVLARRVDPTRSRAEHRAPERGPQLACGIPGATREHDAEVAAPAVQAFDGGEHFERPPHRVDAAEDQSVGGPKQIGGTKLTREVFGADGRHVHTRGVDVEPLRELVRARRRERDERVHRLCVATRFRLARRASRRQLRQRPRARCTLDDERRAPQVVEEVDAARSAIRAEAEGTARVEHTSRQLPTHEPRRAARSFEPQAIRERTCLSADFEQRELGAVFEPHERTHELAGITPDTRPVRRGGGVVDADAASGGVGWRSGHGVAPSCAPQGVCASAVHARGLTAARLDTGRQGVHDGTSGGSERLPPSEVSMLSSLILAMSWLALAPAQRASTDSPVPAERPDAARPVLHAAAMGPAFPGGAQTRVRGFVENRGQWPDEVLFRVGGAALEGWFHADGFTITRIVGEPAQATDRERITGATSPTADPPLPLPTRGHAVRIRFEGAGEHTEVSGEATLPGEHHWLIGADPERHVRGVREHERVRYTNLFEGVDLIARGESGPEGRALFAYDLLLEPGAALDAVVVRCDGANAVRMNAAGELLIETPLGTLRQRAPIAWTIDSDGNEDAARVTFRLIDGRSFGFEGAEDRGNNALVVDPGFQWGTFLGESDIDAARAVALLPGGEPVVAGYTFSPDFPVSPGAFDPQLNGGFDAFVMALTRAGDALLFSTYLGGGDDDLAYGVAVAANGEVYVGGETRSVDFPTPGGWRTTSAGGLDAFVARLDATGSSLLSATYLGSIGDERVRGFTLTPAGDVVVTGSTNSPAFPTLPGAMQTGFGGGTSDGFAARFDGALGVLLASTYLGGLQGDIALAAAAFPDGSVLVGGQTFSTNFPVTAGAFGTSFHGASDGFAVRLNAQHAAVFSTFVGGSSSEAVEAVAVGPQDQVVLAGWTESADLPLVTPAQAQHGGWVDAFAMRLDGAGSQLLESSFLGGSDADRAYAVAVDASGRIALAGGTWSANFPTTPWAFDGTFGNPPDSFMGDVFVARLAPDTLDYSTLLGGNQDEEAFGIVLDAQDQVFVAGQTTSLNFPIHASVFDGSHGGSLLPDGFLARLDFDRYPVEYGQGKTTSVGGQVFVFFDGFPSISGNHGGLVLLVDNAIANSSGWLFHGPTAAQTPFMGGTLLVGPPFVRTAQFPLDWFGATSVPITIPPALVGQTRYFQFWFIDPGDAFGIGLSPGYEVTFYP